MVMVRNKLSAIQFSTRPDLDTVKVGDVLAQFNWTDK